MVSRELIKKIMNREPSERCGFWLGNPLPETIKVYCEKLGKNSLEDIQKFMGDDIRWITPQYFSSTYNHPLEKKLRPWKEANPMGLANGPLSHIETVEEVELYDWPQTKYLDFTETINGLRNMGDYYRLSGFWSPFFHDLTYMLGTEDLLIKMYTHPEVVHAILNRLCGFYLDANELFYQQAGNLIDAHFMGNDFGSQNDLLISPDLFEEFCLPWLRKFADQAHRYGYHSVLHCCGSIYRIIIHLADAGIDCIHPIQVLATNMNAEYLAENFKGKMVFMGGIIIPPNHWTDFS
ncbi:uroporphyrinogen decarboxylase family protein [Parapedobacter sp. 2B3]|uniref:uroporphyrinogen decarboxylase family protein n=1 Tax=Parapedobacter sp. 2B3 TaxID=3342381 RepID=UPI0035B63C3A